MPYVSASHHHAAADGGGAHPGAAAEGRRRRPAEAQPVHPLRDASCCRWSRASASPAGWPRSAAAPSPAAAADIDHVVVPNDSAVVHLHDGDHPDRRHRLHHVARRADHRARHRQRHLAHHLRRHRGPASRSADQQPGRARRARRSALGSMLGPGGLHAAGGRRSSSTSSAGSGGSRCSTPSAWRGGSMFAGQATYFPMKVNTSGVIPPIFAGAILQLPGHAGELAARAGRRCSEALDEQRLALQRRVRRC